MLSRIRYSSVESSLTAAQAGGDTEGIENREEKERC